MKYAFIFGTNIYLSEDRTISYADNGQKIEFLKLQSYYAHKNSKPDNALIVDLGIQTSDDAAIVLNGNQPDAAFNMDLKTAPNRVQIFRDGHHEPIFDIYQLDEHEFAGLPSHITNEIEAQQPGVVFTIKGDFRVAGHRILVDNEKLFVDGDSYANGVTNAHEGILLMPNGVLY